MSAIRQLMMTDMITASPEETVAEVANRMSRNRVGAVLVVQEGKLDGLFSERDLLNRVVAPGLAPSSVRVGEVATRDVVAVDIDRPVKELLDVFRAKRFRHLPVLEGGKPVGILSTRDLLERSVDALESYIEQSAYDRDLKEGADPYEHFGGAYKRP
jgi:CBS domain-containing protein